MEFFKSIDTFKAYAVSGLFALDIVASVLPFFIKSPSWISILESFAAGIFLSTSCSHLIPESLHTFKHITKKPIAPIIWLIVFTFLMVFEMFAHSHNHEHNHDSKHSKEEQAERKKDKGAPLTIAVSPSKSSSSSLVLYSVLVFHTFIESISMGSANSKPVVMAIFLATIGHKPIETFSLGMTMLKAFPSKLTYFLLMLFFSLIEPLAVFGIMYFLPNSSKTFFAVITSASVGVFLFISFQELSEMFHCSEKWNLSKKVVHIFAFVVGAAWMCAISLCGEEHHHHL